MGMDLFSVKSDRSSKKRLYFRFNWLGWSNVCHFLSQLDCDLSEFSGTNDGDIVCPQTCKDVAERITTAWNEGKIVEIYKIVRFSDNIHYFETSAGLSNNDYPNCWVVNHKKGVIISPSDNPFPETLNYVLKCKIHNLPLVMGKVIKVLEGSRWIDKRNVIDMAILESRLKGKPFEPSIRIRPDLDKYEADEEDWNILGYYMCFGKYCERCSHLGGFRQY